MKIGILGAGISGLSIGKMLTGKGFNVQILERQTEYGGIAKTKNINGAAYHMIGGHCFNSKHKDVMEFVFTEVLPESEWHKVQRNAVIRFKNHNVSYPIEFAIKEIFNFDEKLALAISADFLSAVDDGVYSNLEDWFRKKFGNTLTDEYFIPYNTKIWNKKVSEMDPAWVEGKLPIPDKLNFFRGLVKDERDKMPHSEFYYPNSNDQATFINAMAAGLDIKCNYRVDKIELKNGKWIVNDELEYDLIISTLPLNLLPGIIANCSNDVIEAGSKLNYNKVSNVLWETEKTDHTWTYIPDPENLFHRYIHIGNFFNPQQSYTITEVIGEKTFEEMVENGRKDPFLKKPVAYNVSDHAYVVFDENYKEATGKIKDYLKSIGVFTLGRFGEWEYYNMDICIKSSLEMAKVISDKYLGK